MSYIVLIRSGVLFDWAEQTLNKHLCHDMQVAGESY